MVAPLTAGKPPIAFLGGMMHPEETANERSARLTDEMLERHANVPTHDLFDLTSTTADAVPVHYDNLGAVHRVQEVDYNPLEQGSDNEVMRQAQYVLHLMMNAQPSNVVRHHLNDLLSLTSDNTNYNIFYAQNDAITHNDLVSMADIYTSGDNYEKLVEFIRRAGDLDIQEGIEIVRNNPNMNQAELQAHLRALQDRIHSYAEIFGPIVHSYNIFLPYQLPHDLYEDFIDEYNSAIELLRQYGDETIMNRGRNYLR